MFYDFIYLAKGFRMRPKVRSTLNIYIVCAKYQRASVNTLVQVVFLMYALFNHKHNPYLIGK